MLERPKPSLQPRCVLIVEDDDDSRDMLGELVATFGHRPIAAASAADALTKANENCPDVALIDIGLPEVDGCEVARLLKHACKDSIRLIALTGYSDGATRATATAAGFHDYIIKPIMPDKLAAVLNGAWTKL